MKQFRDSRYWVSEDGEVSKHYPPRDYGVPYVYSYYKGVKSRYNSGEERWKIMNPTLRHRSGYLMFNLQCPSVTDKGYFNISVHQMVAEVYCSGYFEGAHVDHIDGNKLNNHYTNLQWCTPEYNNKKRNKTNYPLFAQ